MSLSGLNTSVSVATGPPFEPGDSNCLVVNENIIQDGSGCNGSIIIQDGVTSIGNYSFMGADFLVHIRIPSTVTSIGDGAFIGLDRLESVVFEPGSQLLSIGSYAFADTLEMESFSIPNGVTSIGGNAFNGAIKLTNITIPSSLTAIGDSTFQGATGLTNITIPSSVASIGISAFEGASALTSIVIPNGITEISERTFYGASSLTSVGIPGTVTTIGNRAFESAASLVSITIPSSVTTIRDYVFKDASALSAVRFLGIPPSVWLGSFLGVHPNAKALVNRSQFDSFTAELSNPSSDWTGITPEVFTFPSSDLSCLNSSSTQVLSGVDCVGSITIPNNFTTIDDTAFFHAESLTSITLPSTLTSIGARAFESATSLSLILLMGAAPSVGVDAFLNVASGAIVRIDQVHQSSYVLVDGLWNGLVLEVIIPPVSNTTTSGNAALDQEIERLREAEKKLARANLVTLVRESAPLTLDLFNQASISGVTAKNFQGVAAEIAELPIDRRSQIDEILKIARKFEVVDKVASSDRIYSSMLQEVGLIAQDSKHKAALTAALRKLPASERTSYLAIKQAIDAQMTEIQTRKTRLSEVVAQIAARRKG